MSGALVAGLLAGYGVAVPVGAIAAMLVGLTARTSFRVGAAAALGVATADGLYALAAVLGGAALAGLVRPAAPVLRIVAAAVLVGIAARIALAAVRERRTAGSPAGGPAGAPVSLTAAGRAYLALLGLTVLNPGTVVYFGALVLGRQAAGGLAGWAAAAFVLAAFAASASWQLVLAGAGALVGRFLTGPRGRLLSAVASSIVITVLAVGLLLR